MAEMEIMFSGRMQDLNLSLAGIFGPVDRVAGLKVSVPGGIVTLTSDVEPSGLHEGSFLLLYVPGRDDAFSETVRWLKEFRKKYRRMTIRVTRSLFLPPEYVQMIEDLNAEGRVL